MAWGLWGLNSSPRACPRTPRPMPTGLPVAGHGPGHEHPAHLRLRPRVVVRDGLEQGRGDPRHRRTGTCSVRTGLAHAHERGPVDHDLGLEGVQRVQPSALVPHVRDQDSTRGSMVRPRRDRLAAAHWNPLPPVVAGDQDVDAGDLVSEARQVVAGGIDKARPPVPRTTHVVHLRLQGVSCVGLEDSLLRGIQVGTERMTARPAGWSPWRPSSTPRRLRTRHQPAPDQLNIGSDLDRRARRQGP